MSTTQYRKPISYEQFMKLSPQQRKQHSDYFHKSNPSYCPVIIKITHGNKQVPLRMCKFLIRKDVPMIQEQDRMRNFIIQYSNGGITPKDSVFFMHNKKVIVQRNMLVKDYLKNYFKDLESDGWLHIQVQTMESMGN